MGINCYLTSTHTSMHVCMCPHTHTDARIQTCMPTTRAHTLTKDSQLCSTGGDTTQHISDNTRKVPLIFLNNIHQSQSGRFSNTMMLQNCLGRWYPVILLVSEQISKGDGNFTSVFKSVLLSTDGSRLEKTPAKPSDLLVDRSMTAEADDGSYS